MSGCCLETDQDMIYGIPYLEVQYFYSTTVGTRNSGNVGDLNPRTVFQAVTENINTTQSEQDLISVLTVTPLTPGDAGSYR